MEKVFSSFLHVTCPECGKHILANFARPDISRRCLRCGCTIDIPSHRRGRFHEAAVPPAPPLHPGPKVRRA